MENGAQNYCFLRLAPRLAMRAQVEIEAQTVSANSHYKNNKTKQSYF
jgi:hypothetical protein